ncbi:hypothetical protein [Jiulongibacter sp. NS-SX5]|uniref:hypothetical protein n=1 Tax=Jiulongibacter sp. NS-SX5 TaxID=3463854 RepID=UPI004059053F
MKKTFILFISALFLSILSCNKSSDPSPTDSGVDIEYQENALILEESSSDPVIAIDTTNQVYTFAGSSFSSEPMAGQTILVPGKHMRKVVSVSKSGDNYDIKTEDAILTDVIKEGEISWDVAPEWDQASAIVIDGQIEVPIAKLRRKGPIEVKYSSGGIDHSIKIEPQAVDGKINSCKFTFVMAKKVGGSATAAFTAEGTVKLPTQQTQIGISGGKLSTFKSDNKGITADLKLSLSAAGTKSGSHSFKLPEVALKIPIRFIPTPSGPVPLPIPVSIDIGIQFVTQLTMPDVNSSATASSEVSLSADAGFEYKGSSVSTSGSIGKNNFKDGTFDSAAFIGSPVDIQFGVAFPRVGLNIAGQEVAYIHTGFTTGSSLEWGPLCKKGYVKMVVEGGYELKVLGQTLAKDKETFAEQRKEAAQDGCS